MLADTCLSGTLPIGEPCASFAPGEVLSGTYRLGKLLGAGGMGSVYEAEDLRLRRRVAIKLANEEEHRAALFAEARALAAIHHHGVVGVYALGAHRGRDFLVLERLFGRSLQERVDDAKRRGRTFAIDEVLDILIGIADALAALHRVGMAHRDLKPANVVLCGARTVLVDFGLFVPEFEQSDLIMGSAEFMAPEVVRRSVLPGAGPWVDLYALGIIAFELLTSRTPFLEKTFEQTIRRHVTDDAPASGVLRPDVPTTLTRLVDELLRKDPMERPSSAEEVLWRLSAARSPTGLGAGIRPFRVLVVDDDPVIATVLRRSLRAAMPQRSRHAGDERDRGGDGASCDARGATADDRRRELGRVRQRRRRAALPRHPRVRAQGRSVHRAAVVGADRSAQRRDDEYSADDVAVRAIKRSAGAGDPFRGTSSDSRARAANRPRSWTACRRRDLDEGR